MCMRRTHQRQLGGRRSACVDARACSAREFIAELIWAHEESIALVRALLLSHERAERRQTNADHGVRLAAAYPADREAHDRAVEAAAVAEAAKLAKMDAADKWASHVMYLYGLMAMTDKLSSNPTPTPGGDAPTAAAATAPARFRPRGDCLGRSG